MASETRAAGAATNMSEGFASWSNASFVTSSNDQWAIAQVSPSVNRSDTLWITDFGFGIPLGSTILGISVKVERSRTGIGAPVTIVDRSVILSLDGEPHGDDKADTTTAWPATDTDKTYGGSSDTWGVIGFDPLIINDPRFGLFFSCKTLDAAGDTADCNVDYVEITVTYSQIFETAPWTDYGMVVKRQRRRVVAPFGDTPTGA